MQDHQTPAQGNELPRSEAISEVGLKLSNAPTKPPQVNVRTLFRFADGADVLFMVLGSISAVANGVIMPLFSLVFGSLIALFQEGEILSGKFDLQSEINRLALYFVYLAIAGFFLTLLEYLFWYRLTRHALT